MNHNESHFGDQNLLVFQGCCYWQAQQAWRLFIPLDLNCVVLGKSEVSLSKRRNLQNGDTDLVNFGGLCWILNICECVVAGLAKSKLSINIRWSYNNHNCSKYIENCIIFIDFLRSWHKFWCEFISLLGKYLRWNLSKDNVPSWP